MKIQIRHEQTDDYSYIREIYYQAYGRYDENVVVECLRTYTNFITELSLIAEIEGRIVGHVLFYPVRISQGAIKFATVTLMPVGILPDWLGKGVTNKLIDAGIAIAERKGLTSIIAHGQPEFLSKFGFAPAYNWNITAPFDIEDETFMIKELTENGGLIGISGVVEYPKELMK